MNYYYIYCNAKEFAELPVHPPQYKESVDEQSHQAGRRVIRLLSVIRKDRRGRTRTSAHLHGQRRLNERVFQ